MQLKKRKENIFKKKYACFIIESNDQEILFAFTRIWMIRGLLINSNKSYYDFFKENSIYLEQMKKISSETTKLMLVFVDYISNQNFKKEGKSFTIKKWLNILRNILLDNVRSNFKYKNVVLPKINVEYK